MLYIVYNNNDDNNNNSKQSAHFRKLNKVFRAIVNKLLNTVKQRVYGKQRMLYSRDAFVKK